MRAAGRVYGGEGKMNIHDPNVTLPKVTTGALPASRKVYAKP